jgi:Tfp pilus assembly protein PilF
MDRWAFFRVFLVAGVAAGLATPTHAQRVPPPSAPAVDEPVLPPAPGQGGQQSRLDRLFDSLAGSETPEEAKRIESNIEAIWLQSGSATADLLTRRALDAYQRDDHSAALTLLTAAIDSAPEHAEAYNKRATVYLVEGNIRRGLFDLREALRLEPRHYGAWISLARVMDQMGDEAGALEAFRRGKALNPYIEEIDANIERLELIVRGREI